MPHQTSARRGTPRGPARAALPAALPPILPAALVAVLAGCGPQDESGFAPQCAPVGILAEAADYSDYGGAVLPDLGRLVSHGSIVGVSGHCSSAAGGLALHTVVSLQLAVTRGPAGPGHSLSVPYFVAAIQDARVVAKQRLAAVAEFPDNGDQVLVRTDPIALDLPVTSARPGTSYRIEVGFQLSAPQLAYNRAHMPR